MTISDSPGVGEGTSSSCSMGCQSPGILTFGSPTFGPFEAFELVCKDPAPGMICGTGSRIFSFDAGWVGGGGFGFDLPFSENA